MDRLRPATRAPVKFSYWKAPNAFKTWADIQNFFRLQGCEPNHFRDGVGHPAKPLLARLQSRFSPLALNGHRRNVRGLLDDLVVLRIWAARFAPINRKSAQHTSIGGEYRRGPTRTQPVGHEQIAALEQLCLGGAVRDDHRFFSIDRHAARPPASRSRTAIDGSSVTFRQAGGSTVPKPIFVFIQ